MLDIQTVRQYASVIFAFVMLAYWTGSFVLLYHLIRFGVGSQPKKIALFFFIGSLVLSIITTLFFAQTMLLQK
jgi:ABC-type multidrug transport system permease subunit